MKKFLAALQLLTIIPVKIKNLQDDDIAGSAGFFPMVGLIIGAILLGLDYLICLFMPVMAANVILLLLWVILTGGLHLDGLADTVDGFSAGGDKDRILKVMGDPATGAKGVVSLILVLLIKFSILCCLGGHVRMLALLTAPLFSRYSLMFAAFSSKPAHDGMGTKFMKLGLRSAKLDILFNTFLVIFFIYLSDLSGIWGIASALLFTLLFVQYCNKKIGGMTGDTLGALNEITEAIVLLCMLVVRMR